MGTREQQREIPDNKKRKDRTDRGANCSRVLAKRQNKIPIAGNRCK